MTSKAKRLYFTQKYAILATSGRDRFSDVNCRRQQEYKKDRTQKVTENAFPSQTPFPSSHINQILPVGSYLGYLSWLWVSLKSVEKCGSSGGSKFWPSHWLDSSLIQQLVATAQPVIHWGLNISVLLVSVCSSSILIGWGEATIFQFPSLSISQRLEWY